MGWGGVKKQTNIEAIEAWCNEIGIEDYSINSQGEIDVNGDVDLHKEEFDILPYKFGEVNGYFDVDYCKNLISLKNFPDYINKWFSCDDCSNLDSLEGCPKEVGGSFFCRKSKHKFTKEEVQSLCKVGGCMYL